MQEPIHGLSFEQLESACRQLGQPSWRAAQIWDWLYVKQINGWDDMRNLPRALRGQLADRFLFTAVQPEQQTEETEPGAATNKIGSILADGEIIETVLIPASGKSGISRQTVCVSSQAGCKFHCAFCASGQLGFARNLSTAEIVEQVLIFARRLETPPTHVVFMGIGEPLDNSDYQSSRRTADRRPANNHQHLRHHSRDSTSGAGGLANGIVRVAARAR
jgi:23S rRNA (adenine2503-C2)-methyltransferase